MFDVRPVNSAGDLDMEKIGKVKKTAEIFEKNKNQTEFFLQAREDRQVNEEKLEREILEEELGKFKEIFGKKSPHVHAKTFQKYLMASVSFSLIVFSTFFIFNFISRGIELQTKGLVKGQAAFAELMSAKDNLKEGNFQKSYVQFRNAHENLSEISSQLSGMGVFLINAMKYVPYLSKVSSVSSLVSAGENISEVGVLISGMLETIEEIKSGDTKGESISYLKLFQKNEKNLEKISGLLEEARDNLDKVDLKDIPEENKGKFIEMKKMLPEINLVLWEFLREEKIFVDILGGNGPRKYLFLFQNNQEMRATGGFIGSYGLLDIFEGRVRKFFIDGIFNPDGQLRERIVPPLPIQKISANWSLHDSNWFPDFPLSAEKAAWFYEKTGGPTVDGVIAMTPTVMQKLLEITGPIEMEEYNVTVDAQNFIEKIQYEVEIDYDKELNQPKKILADLTPKILDKIFNSKNFSDMSKTLNIILESLNEKQILIYSKNWEIEKVLSDNGWSGEILETPKDYVSVINTNINGFKTDGVIDEKISHKAEIQKDGSIVDRLTITRHHNGGDSPYEWWNKVNANYMRVYVPKGSRLLGAEGQTREFNAPPLDYSALGYRRDPHLQIEENSAEFDEQSGTRIYEDNNKTVFANWVYVSPKETVTLTYTYVLPFKIDISAKRPADTYSLLVQKQSGSLGSKLVSEIHYPDSYNILWRYPEKDFSSFDNLPDNLKGIRVEHMLNMDRFIGLAFTDRS